MLLPCSSMFYCTNPTTPTTTPIKPNTARANTAENPVASQGSPIISEKKPISPVYDAVKDKGNVGYPLSTGQSSNVHIEDDRQAATTFPNTQTSSTIIANSLMTTGNSHGGVSIAGGKMITFEDDDEGMTTLCIYTAQN